MDKKNLIKKGLTIAVIILFIGIAVAPSINANIGKEALVDFTTEVCGLNGGKQTVKLTQKEADEVEALFDSVRERLNATESREEAEEIFKEAVVDLDKYGLLGGLTVKQAQRLVTGGYQNLRIAKIFNKLVEDGRISDNNSNFLCLVAGDTGYYTQFQGPLCWGYLSLHFQLLDFLEKIVEWSEENSIEIVYKLLYNLFGLIVGISFSFL